MKQEVKNLAKTWLKNSEKYKSFSDKIYAKKMDKFFQNSRDKSVVISMMDKAFRPNKNRDIARVIGRIPHLSFLSFFEQILVGLFNVTRSFCYFFSIPLLKKFIYFTTSKYVLFGCDKTLEKRIRKNLQSGLNTNLNRVGELLLGEDDAKKRIEQYVRDLENPAINCISIKISTIYSQISSIAFEQTVLELVDRISIIYRAAKNNKYTCEKTGQKLTKLVNFDMEEYRDLAITVETFIRALSKDEFKDLTAGIALQAYLPDSFLYLQKITNWAKQRVENKGAPARVRIVKGANMDMELFESREKNWSAAPFSSKAMTDANYKKMIEFSLQKENISAVKIGVASHNLFDIGYVYLLAKQNDALDFVTFEMLSGMSEHVAKMFAKELKLNVLIYLPFSSKKDFVSSIGYLVRRLDENTSPDNYLRYLNGLEENQENLEMLEKKFEESLELKAQNNFPINRVQNRLQEGSVIDFDNFGKTYQSSEDTDFSLPQNYEFAQNIKNKWQNISNLKVCAVIAGREIPPLDESHKIKDHNTDEKIVGYYHGSTIEEAHEALICADTSDSWRNLSTRGRLSIIAKVVDNIRARRGDLIGIMALETGKSFIESDGEISEAIDFGNYYSHSLLQMESEVIFVNFSAKKNVLVLSPWNFPLAIPAGGIFAALIAGSNVIFKPSNLATAVGYELAKCFFDAGVPKDALQFIPSFNSAVAMELTKSKLIDMIVFTGGTNTALSIIKNNPEVKIIAETGGKNVTIVTKYADKDQAIKNVLQSAFSSAGQKCSATSIFALEEEIYDDEKFLHTLIDAVESLVVDYAWNLKTKVNSIIRKPTVDLEYGLTSLESHERWLVKPKCMNENKTLWTPGLKIGTKIGDKSHFTEFFGPVLAIMKIKDLQGGIELANSTGYGLTSALESLNKDEQLFWKGSIQAGNLYINRPSTGAIVERQPFGGMNKSAFGTGTKAGGLNYIYQFFNFSNDEAKKKSLKVVAPLLECEYFKKIAEDLTLRDEHSILAVLQDYITNYKNYFSQEFDYQKILGQSNITRFLQLPNIVIRADKSSACKDLILSILAAKLCVKKTTISIDVDVFEEKISQINKISSEILSGASLVKQDETSFANDMQNFKRARIIGKISLPFFKKKAATTGMSVIGEDLIYKGRVELLHYLQEQSISNNYHRFGYTSNNEL
jgi:RHH-type proline utilization regulon transcriptional repressor/proline dehydrogenase/delta 1-pyrroline-5-carboxylate dehydrogenase